MKIIIINTPNRDAPTNFPPVGSLSIINYLRKNGFGDVEFINVDYYRQPINELVQHIVDSGIDIVGVSAVTSTSYSFTKEITLKIKALNPKILIVLGGNMAASAEIILKKTGVDFCVLGEGERIFLNFVKKVIVTQNLSEFKEIPGLMYVDNISGQIVNTGYEDSLGTEELYDIDLNDLKGAITHYISNVFDDNGKVQMRDFSLDKRTYEIHRRGKKHFQLLVGKGCVAKCTFCHRWDKGIKHIPVTILMERLDFIIKKYNVGFVSPSIEAFAVDKKWLSEFCSEIKKRDVLWRAGAVRAKSVSPNIIQQMKDSGCVSIIYGLESGSDKILSIMEKRTTMKENYDAQKWAVEAGFYTTTVQLVLGMPGEDEETINDTLKFSQYAYLLSEFLNPVEFSINYVQALPGTPLYEYGRRIGLIGDELDTEEKYLISVSDQNAGDIRSIVNFTGYPRAVLASWKYILYYGTINAYIAKYGLKHLMSINPTKNRIIFFSYIIMFRLRFFMPIIVLLKDRNQFGGFRCSLKYWRELILYWFGIKGSGLDNDYLSFNKSLRKIVNNDLPEISSDIPQMKPLRKGR